MKIAIVGSTKFNDFSFVSENVNKIISDLKIQVTTIVSGGAKGVDALAEQYATSNNLNMIVHNAEWNYYGRAAGPIRNKLIIEDSDLVIAFWNGISPGTKSSVNIAKKAGKKVIVVSI